MKYISKDKIHIVRAICFVFVLIALCIPAFCMTGCSGGDAAAGEEFDIKVNISGESYDKSTSTQAIMYIQQVMDEEGNAVSEQDNEKYELFYLNEEKTIKVPKTGTYAISFVSPINSDGALYEMPSSQKVSVTSDEPGKFSGTATLISADAVDAALMQEVVDTINAVYNATDDKDVKKQMKSMLKLMEQNVEASPTAEAVNTENTGSTDAIGQSSRVNSESSDNGGNASSGYTSDSGSGTSGTAAGSGSGSSAGSTSGSGSGDTSGQESGSGESGGASGGDYEDFQEHHAHEWEYYTALEYVGTYLICNQCGAQVSDSASHNCTGTGCSFHTEDVYDEHPVRTCWCGATEYL